MDKVTTCDTPNVNGTPDSDATLWHSIDWAMQEDHVRRLGQRIYKAQKEGNLKQVRNLQKLMLRSRANLLLGVKRVTQLSHGKKTAGIDERPEEAEQLKARLSEWLAPRGLFINEEKTRIVHLDEGFDFLGFTVRRYRNGKLIIRPSRDAVMRLRGRIREIIREMRGATAEKLIARLNPLLKGWSIYYRAVVSSRVFKGVDAYVYTALWRWAVARHRNKSGWWVSRRYWGQHKADRRDQWVFGENGSHLYKLAWTRIVRHQEVRGSASKYDPDLADYWAHRSKKRRMPGLENRRIISLAARQKGLCPGCSPGVAVSVAFMGDIRNISPNREAHPLLPPREEGQSDLQS